MLQSFRVQVNWPPNRPYSSFSVFAESLEPFIAVECRQLKVKNRTQPEMDDGK